MPDTIGREIIFNPTTAQQHPGTGNTPAESFKRQTEGDRERERERERERGKTSGLTGGSAPQHRTAPSNRESERSGAANKIKAHVS